MKTSAKKSSAPSALATVAKVEPKKHLLGGDAISTSEMVANGTVPAPATTSPDVAAAVASSLAIANKSKPALVPVPAAQVVAPAPVAALATPIVANPAPVPAPIVVAKVAEPAPKLSLAESIT